MVLLYKDRHVASFYTNQATYLTLMISYHYHNTDRQMQPNTRKPGTAQDGSRPFSAHVVPSSGGKSTMTSVYPFSMVWSSSPEESLAANTFLGFSGEFDFTGCILQRSYRCGVVTWYFLGWSHGCGTVKARQGKATKGRLRKGK